MHGSGLVCRGAVRFAKNKGGGARGAVPPPVQLGRMGERWKLSHWGQGLGPISSASQLEHIRGGFRRGGGGVSSLVPRRI